MEYLFSYGTLRNEEIQLAIFGRVVSTTLEALPDYVLRTVTLINWKAAEISGGDTQKTVEPCPGDGLDWPRAHERTSGATRRSICLTRRSSAQIHFELPV